MVAEMRDEGTGLQRSGCILVVHIGGAVKNRASSPLRALKESRRMLTLMLLEAGDSHEGPLCYPTLCCRSFWRLVTDCQKMSSIRKIFKL